MPKTNLTEDEKAKIIEALNENTEPSPELMEKLFPSVAEKFDVAKLDRSKVVSLEYAGKRSEAAILNMTSPTDAGSPLQVERCFSGGSLTCESQLDLFQKAKETGSCEWQNLIVQGDNLQFLKTCYQNSDPLIKNKIKKKVRLVYIDPPFATRGDFSTSSGDDAYSDKLQRAEFVESLRERLILIRELLASDASIYLHCDWRMNSYLRIVLDEVFGRERFCAEIKWKRVVSSGSSKAISKKFPVVCDSVLFYTASSVYLWNPVYSGYSEKYKKRFNKKDARGWYYWDNLKSYSEETLQRLIKEERVRLPKDKGKTQE